MNAHVQHTATSFDPILADAWRGSACEVEDHIRFIAQHNRTIAEKDERICDGTVRLHSAEHVENCRKMIALRLPLYAQAVRRVSEAETRMRAIGMPFAKSSWED